MKRAIRKAALLVVVTGLLSCGNSLHRADYLGYVTSEKHGLKKEVVVGDWQYEIQYKPYDYIIYSEHRDNIHTKVYRRRMEQLKGTAWFNISFRKKNTAETPLKADVSGLEEYNERLSYFLEAARRDISLTCDGRTAEPMSYLFETNYGLTPQETMVVGFQLPDDKAPEKDLQVAFYDRVFGNGIIKATITGAALQKAAAIKVTP